MNKAELIDKIKNAENSTITATKLEIDRILKALTHTIIEAVAEGEDVVLVNFGTFKAKDSPEKEMRNPRTGETLIVPAHKKPSFKAGKGFKDKLKNTL